MDARYLDVARLLVQVAPTVFAGHRFALKGGTAINLFVVDMPRLSVDLDVVFVDAALDRESALDTIDRDLASARGTLTARGYRVTNTTRVDGRVVALAIVRGDISVKVEVNAVLRGTLRPTRQAGVLPDAAGRLRATATLPLLATDELYGGKLVAALDRQHPRDLFDVDVLLRTSGIDDAIVECFVAYLACHNRPLDEVLFARPKDIAANYRENFVGMAVEEVPLDRLLDARARIMRELPRRLSAGQRTFLRSLARAEPDFAALGLPQLEAMPGMRWKLANLAKLRDTNRRKLDKQAAELDRRLGEIA